ncbi:phosphate uptake regulator PhoU [Candidatus Woesearchaeota archaeon]|nr:phosphate uptake regulator PhoU [Candidatus Woesearchaeota archaeon]
MKRKVIQIANSTQLISLPRKWSQKYGVKKGDEIEVEENGNSIIITTEKEISSSKTEIDFRGKQNLIHRTLSSLYRSGYDEIKIYFDKHTELEIIQSTINRELIGFEIIEQGKEYIIVKQVSNIDYSEFDSMLRRTFLFLLSTADECLDALKTSNVNTLKSLILKDITINKLTDYCRRALNKKEVFFKHIGPGYAIIELLEKIGDGYRDLCKYLAQNKIKINKYIIEILSQLNILLKDSYKLFYDFNINSIEKFLINKENIENSIINLSKKTNKDEVMVLIHLNTIMNNIFYLNGPLMIHAL